MATSQVFLKDSTANGDFGPFRLFKKALKMAHRCLWVLDCERLGLLPSLSQSIAV
ncbi:hypothetical protein [Virgibacillus chiguensis]|uniref:hypothetical protein n=1 Tax=Virgibacillus chiguensis TaxID=411959 RepID=UPI001BB047E9|nr:hypothetical protein [Virgibacillus chiguensis]